MQAANGPVISVQARLAHVDRRPQRLLEPAVVGPHRPADLPRHRALALAADSVAGRCSRGCGRRRRRVVRGRLLPTAVRASMTSTIRVGSCSSRLRGGPCGRDRNDRPGNAGRAHGPRVLRELAASASGLLLIEEGYAAWDAIAHNCLSRSRSPWRWRAVLYAVFHLWLPLNYFGGEIAFTMVPIMVLSLRRGVAAGVLAGALWGLLQAMAEPAVHRSPGPGAARLPRGVRPRRPHRAGLARVSRSDRARSAPAAPRESPSRRRSLGAVGQIRRARALGRGLLRDERARGPAGTRSTRSSTTPPTCCRRRILSIPATVIVVLALERSAPSTSHAQPQGV